MGVPQDKNQLTLPACLIIMDGFGLAEPGPGNAISLAKTPHLDALFKDASWTRLEASGEAVGLPAGQMGNSEVGHLNIGAGRVVYQELTRINNACRSGELAHNDVLRQAFDQVKQNDSVLHFMGLLSDGGVHSSNEHLFALMQAAKDAGVARVFIHCFVDGRDVPPKSGIDYVSQLQTQCDELTDGSFSAEIASVSGRYYAMDRDRRWDRVEKAWNAIVCASPVEDASGVEVMKASYANDTTDEFVVPVSLQSRGVQDLDAVVFFNFRPDRARELSRAFVDVNFDGFDRGRVPQTYFVCLTEYDPEITAPVAFAKEFPEDVLADVLSEAGLRQYHIAETEKYAHVTFFLNGGKEEPKLGEDRKLIASPKVATYDLQPEMSEPDVAESLVKAIENDEADVYIVNFANPDMVGHTGVIPAAVKAVEAVDEGVGLVLDAIAQKHGIAFVTADHGNADKMIEADDTPFTAHTTALVPFIFVDYANTGKKIDEHVGALCDIAPTLLDAIGMEAPQAMTGSSLLCE